MKRDAIAIVEAAYRLDASEQEWIEGLVEAAEDLIEGSLGMSAHIMRMDDEIRIGPIAGAESARPFLARQMHEEADLEVARAYYTPGLTFGTSSTHDLDVYENIFLPAAEPHGIRDFVGVHIISPGYDGVVLGAPTPERYRPTESEKRRWLRICAHVAAGFRLREALKGEPTDLDSAAAVFEEDGTLAGASESLSRDETLDDIRGALERVSTARGRLREEDPDRALELWKGLVEGKWSLVEQFDTDGRRYIVLRENEPRITDPRSLSPRERQVTYFAALGHTDKFIAYELGISESSVSTLLIRARRKLGAPTRVDLIRTVRALINLPGEP